MFYVGLHTRLTVIKPVLLTEKSVLDGEFYRVYDEA